MQKFIAFILIVLTSAFGSGCMTFVRAVGGGRGSFSTDKIDLLEKHGNDGHVTMYHNGQIVGQFVTPYHLEIPRSDTGVYTFYIKKNGFKDLEFKMYMGLGSGTAGNAGFLVMPIVAVGGVSTDKWITKAGNTMSGGAEVEEDGNKVYYKLTPNTMIADVPQIQQPSPAQPAQIPQPEIQMIYVTNQVPVYVDRLVPTTNTVIIVPPTVRPAGGSSGGTATSGEIFVNPRRN